jgi:rare lipoprotein A
MKMIKNILCVFYFLFTVPLMGNTEHGWASWYSVKCNGGTKTASGIPLNDNANTAASRTHPMGTLVRITNLKNNKSEVVMITDHGPSKKLNGGKRIIDVTKKVAEKLGFKEKGLAKSIKVEVVGKKKI